jgi:septal ring factor EnvC (AmiA/AmiB activator)
LSKRESDFKKIDEEFTRIIKHVKKRRDQLKEEYEKAHENEIGNIEKELENYATHLSLLNFNIDTMKKTLTELGIIIFLINR